ncbi:MAG: FAD-dependent monooxygenase [Moritella sp.]|uniref:FAD-dependent monooxygenase n=1 Tax=unclassified Moritella TaxID=2637987 RepID=UPI0001568F0E|nr:MULTISPECIES: FAD-dependent monooxygenase [unclassified Moritella]EDM65624.1 putative flavoprotein monooxygenase acting on aromatic compound [Moritella sp. PE36]MBL1418092.1 FAD-dependent monooxygenase [Moritella sp.]
MKIGILGGGISGLSTAIALKQDGFDVDIYERHSRPSEIGAGIVCWPNASFVLDQLGVLSRVAKVSGSLNYMHRFSSNGEPLGSLDISQLNQLMAYPSYSIIRKDLMSILTQRAVELSINIHYQHDVTSLSNNDDDKVRVQFSNGKNIEPDIIVGTDGRMNSFARKYVNGNNEPVYQGFINWIGVFECKNEIFTELSVLDYLGVGERFGIVPVSKTKAYWAGGVVSPNIGEPTPELYKSELRSLFTSWPDPICKIINETPLSRINKIYVHDHNPIKIWHKNNLVLLGDAAHSALPTSGQGACQALEDAWHFVNCLKENINDISKVFKHFTELRMAKTSKITMGGRQVASSIFNQDQEFCKHRNLASKNMDHKSTVIGIAKLWTNGLPISV